MSNQLQRLGRLFDEMNRKYFGGRLKKRRVRWATWNSSQRKGLCTSKAIYIQRGLEPDEVMATLLHEMCHIITGSGHGKRFRAVISRLDAQGAPIDKTDLLPGIFPHLVLPMTIDDIAIEPAFSTWRHVRRYLGRDLHMSGAAVERKYPWARKRWARQRAELRADERHIEALRQKLGSASD
jgi:hypothetical protein